MRVIAKILSVAMFVGLGLALAAPVRASETELIGAQTPWRVFLRVGPYVGRKDGALVGTLIHDRESRPGDFAKAEFLKTWTDRHSPSPADGWFRADFDDSGWGRYQTDELGDLTGGYGGGFENGTGRTWPDRFYLRTCFGISDPAAARDLSLELAYLGGAVLWRREHGTTAPGWIKPGATPAVADGRVYVVHGPATDPQAVVAKAKRTDVVEVRCLDAATGRDVWRATQTVSDAALTESSSTAHRAWAGRVRRLPSCSSSRPARHRASRRRPRSRACSTPPAPPSPIGRLFLRVNDGVVCFDLRVERTRQ